MPKSKARQRKDEPGLSSSQEHSTAPGPYPVKSNLNEASFNNLRDKIQAKLQNEKTAAKKTNGTRADDVSSQQYDAESKRGKKRSSDGKVLDKKKQKRQAEGLKDTDSHAAVDGEEDDLRKAMKDLGGTDEDMQLLVGAESDSEMEGNDPEPRKETVIRGTKSLEQGMANILKEIALAQGLQTDVEPVEESEPEVREVEKAHVKEEQRQPVEKSTEKKGGKSRLKCEPRPDWFSMSLDIDLEKEQRHTPSPQSVEQLHLHAKALLSAENEAFATTQQASSSQAFYNTVIASGTLSDKISALTLAVQESPLHNVKPLEMLIGLAGKRSRAQAMDVLRALKDLLAQGSVLPPNRRLLTFSSQPGLVAALGQVKSWKQGDSLPRHLHESALIVWAYEDWLKSQYFEILKILEVWCNDEIEFSKSRAVSYVYELLKERPEQESNLLRLLINKIGDPIKKIASQTSYLLMQLLVSHPAMKMVVISAVETDFLFRPGQSVHGKYYAVTTLNQTALSVREEAVANKLLDIYFGLFTGLLKTASDSPSAENGEVVSFSRAQRQRKKKKGTSETNQQGEELKEKLTSAILTGVNRAYPYAGADQRNFDQHLDTLFRITHSANFNTSIQAMMLIQQLTTTHGAAADRYYRTLYESLLDPRLIAASKQQLYLNLLHRSLKADLSAKRVKAFVKRLLQILSLQEPAFVCGAFFLLKDLETTFPSLTALIDQAEQDEDDEEVFRDVEEGNSDAGATINSVKLPLSNRYDGHKRGPEHANADNSCVWEVVPFLAHFHPSVSINADHYLQQLKLPGKPDLTLHTLIHFLDRFVYRNPKLLSNKMRGTSIMQPMASDDTHAVLINSATGLSGPAVNTDAFRNKKDQDVAADEVFFHKYFSGLGKETKSKKAKKDRGIDDDDSVGDEGEDAVWKAMMDSAPDLEGAESDDDLDMSDFEAEMDGEGDISDEGEAGRLDDDDNESEVDIEAGIFDESDEDMLSMDAENVEASSADDSGFDGFESDEAKLTNKQKQNKSEKDRRKKMKGLPTFAAVSDYAKMLEDDDDEDLG